MKRSEMILLIVDIMHEYSTDIDCLEGQVAASVLLDKMEEADMAPPYADITFKIHSSASESRYCRKWEPEDVS